MKRNFLAIYSSGVLVLAVVVLCAGAYTVFGGRNEDLMLTNDLPFPVVVSEQGGGVIARIEPGEPVTLPSILRDYILWPSIVVKNDKGEIVQVVGDDATANSYSYMGRLVIVHITGLTTPEDASDYSFYERGHSAK